MAINPNFIKASIAIGLLEGSTCPPANFQIKPKWIDVDVRFLGHKKSKGEFNRLQREQNK